MVFLPTKAVILDDEILTNDWKSYYGMIRDFIAQFVGGDKAESVVISDGVITPTKGFVVVDSENELDIDEISQIKIDNYVDGSFIALTMANKDHTIVLKQGESADGGIFTYTGANETMKMGDVTLLRRDGNYWRQVDLSGYMRATDDEMGLMSSKYKTASLNQLAPYLENRSLYAVGVLVWAVRKPEGMVPCDNSIEYRLDQFPAVSTLLNNGVLPKVTYSAYNSAISSTGICASFGYDSANGKFYPPYLKPRVIEGTSYYPYISLYNAVTAQSLIDQQGILDECMALYANIQTEYQNFVNYIDEQMMSISDAVDDAVATVEGAQAGAVSVVNSTKDTAVQTINNTATSAVQRVEDAYTDFDTLYQEKTQGLITTANNQIVNIDNAAQENIAKSRTWATGEDAEVEVLEAGEHSSRGYADLAMAIANADEDVPVDASKLVALDTIRGPRGYTGDRGVGIPAGGNDGQVIVKNGTADYDLRWENVQIDTSDSLHLTGDETASGVKTFTDNIYAPNQVSYNKITNCITEIPQDIKLVLNNGTLTLKAGSKVYVPNGAGVFDEKTISADISVSPNDGEKMFFLHPDGTQIYHANVSNQIYSGTTQPSITYGFWYDTTNNVVKFTSNGSTWTSGFSLPIAKGSNTSIDQVFNGFGYIGSTVFALPNVKGLIPNGRNADGTLKNEEFTVSKVLTVAVYNSKYNMNAINLAPAYHTSYAEQEEQPSFANGNWYQPSTNIMYLIGNGVATPTNIAYVLDLSATDGKATDINPKLPFRAVDQNEFNKLDEEAAKLNSNNLFTGNNEFKGIFKLLYQDGNEGAQIDWKTGSNSVIRDTVIKQDVVDHRMRFFAGNSAGTVVFPLTLNFETGLASTTTPPASDNSQAVATTAWFHTALRGSLMAYAGATAPTGWLKCDGSAVSRTTYSALFAIIGTTYGAGDGSTTFNLPNFVNKTFWGGTGAGQSLSQTLPNIKGTFAGGIGDRATATGAFTRTGTDTASTKVDAVGDSNAYSGLFSFNANSSNSVYQDGAVVRPNVIQTLICIKY